MHDDVDFKEMSTLQAQELIIFFLELAFQFPRESLLANKQTSELRDSTLLLLNVNFLFYQGLACLN